MSRTCPKPEDLSRVIDGDFEGLEAEVAEELRRHAADCPTCRAERTRLERAAAALRAIPAPPMPTSAGGADCLRPAELLAVLSPNPPARVEVHLDACDPCLREAMVLLRTHVAADRLASPVPAALAARVASRWKAAAPEAGPSAFVLRVGRAGLELVRRHVVAPLVEIEPSPLSAALRAGEEAARAPVRFHLKGAAGSIEATAFADGEAVRLEIALHDASGARMAGQRIHLRQDGRSRFSARTASDGSLQLPRIEPGSYEISCPSIETTFRLDLHA